MMGCRERTLHLLDIGSTLDDLNPLLLQLDSGTELHLLAAQGAPVRVEFAVRDQALHGGFCGVDLGGFLAWECGR